MNISTYLSLFAILFCNVEMLQSQFVDLYGSDKDKIYSDALVPFPENDLYGFMDRQGKVVIKPDYESVFFFDEHGYAKVAQFGFQGIIDKKGKMIVPTIDSSIDQLPIKWCNNKQLDYEKHWLKGIYKLDNYKSKEYVFYKYDDIKNEYIVSDIYNVNQSSLHDKIDYSAKEMGIDQFYLGYNRVVDIDSSVNFIDTNFVLVLPKNIYDGQQLSGGYFSEYNEAGKCRLINKDGEPQSDFTFDKIKYSGYENHFIAELKIPNSYESNVGLMDEKGVLLIEPKDIKINHLNAEYFEVGSNSMKSVYTVGQGYTTDSKYSSIQEHFQDKFIATDTIGSYLINARGKVLSDLFSVSKLGRGKGYAIIKEDEKEVIIDEDGKRVFEVPDNMTLYTYDKEFVILKDQEGFLMLDQNGKDYFDGKQKKIIPTGFDNRIYVDGRFQDGVYNVDTKQWDIPMGKSTIVCTPKGMASPISKLIVTSDKEIITITGEWNNRTVVERSNGSRRSGGSMSTRIEGDIKIVSFPNGDQYTLPKDRDIDARQSNGETYLVEKFGRQNTVLVNKDLIQVSPLNYRLDGNINIGGKLYFKVKNEQRFEGLIDIYGQWVIEAAERIDIRPGKGLCVVKRGYEVDVYDEEFNLISTNEYLSVLWKDEYVVFEKKDSPTIDIFHRSGGKISSDTYTKLLRSGPYYLSVTDERTGTLNCSILDSLGSKQLSFPYVEVYPTNESMEQFIAKDLLDFGVVDSKGDVLIPFKYKEIKWFENIGLFTLRKSAYYNDIVDQKLELKAKDLNSYINFHPVADKFYVRGDNEHYLFDSDGSFVQSFPATLGDPSFSNGYMELSLIKFTKNGMDYFVDANSGKVYLP